jgi:hypothetical protein
MLIRKTGRNLMAEFKFRWRYELWDNVFNNDHHNEVDILFNSNLNIYLEIFYSCFPEINLNDRPNKKSWLTTGIRISCKRKGDLY